MITRAIQKEYWFHYFDLLSKITQGRHVLLEVVGEEVGDQIEEDWSPVEELYFDMEADTLYVRTPILVHPIFDPQTVVIQEDGMVRTIGIRDGMGDLQLLHFRNPLLIEGRIPN